MQKIDTNGVTIRSWCPSIEEGALDQMKAIAELPYVKECCLMPDAHFGTVMPIGGVVSTDNVVVPQMVGVDIGCGVCALKTDVMVDELTDDKSKIIFNLISQNVPVGFSHNTCQRIKYLANKYEDKYNYIVDKSKIQLNNDTPIGETSSKAFFSQLGTLGGGNHFLEVQVDEDDYIWIMIHSGSRNMGNKVGNYFTAIAQDMNAKWFSESRDIPFLPTETSEGKSYLSWMDFALRFAFLNRSVMMESVKEVFKQVFPSVKWITSNVVDDTVGDIINIHHNFAALENHHGKNVWVHRKGATRAFDSHTGIIPGSMGTNSYIVKGLGNHSSLMSSSHGAGRKMGRMEFSRQMKDKMAEVEASMEGIIHSEFGEFAHGKMKGVKDVSEAPMAYKDINVIMSLQSDLVEPIVKLTPKISIKG